MNSDFTQEQIEAICSMWDDGFTAEDISYEIGEPIEEIMTVIKEYC